MKIGKPHIVLLSNLFAVLLFTLGCGSKTEEIAGEGLVDRFKKRKHWLSVYAKPNINISNLFRIDHFGGYSPGHRISEALLLYGEPHTHVPAKRGLEYIVYESDFGVIRLGAESTVDGNTSYPMYFVPHDKRPSSFFCESITGQIDMTAEKQVVMIFDYGYRQPHTQAVIEFGKIQEVIFINKEAIE